MRNSPNAEVVIRRRGLVKPGQVWSHSEHRADYIALSDEDVVQLGKNTWKPEGCLWSIGIGNVGSVGGVVYTSRNYQVYVFLPTFINDLHRDRIMLAVRLVGDLGVTLRPFCWRTYEE